MLVALIAAAAGFALVSLTDSLALFAVALFFVATPASIVMARWVSRSFPDDGKSGDTGRGEQATAERGAARVAMAVAACCFALAAVLGVERASQGIRVEFVIVGLVFVVLAALLRGYRRGEPPSPRS